MTKAEKRLLVALLEMASDTYSNHGCNDFKLDKYVPDARERDRIVEAIFGTEEYEQFFKEERPKVPDYRAMDYDLMRYFAEKIEKSLTEPVFFSGPPC